MGARKDAGCPCRRLSRPRSPERSEWQEASPGTPFEAALVQVFDHYMPATGLPPGEAHCRGCWLTIGPPRHEIRHGLLTTRPAIRGVGLTACGWIL
jgi:hypothetical protein